MAEDQDGANAMLNAMRMRDPEYRALLRRVETLKILEKEEVQGFKHVDQVHCRQLSADNNKIHL
mgnify:CR=1 FL=1